MSTSLFPLVTLTITTAIGICLFVAMIQMRRAYSEQRYRFVRAIAAVEEFQKHQKEFVALLRRVESDGHALQQIAVQVEIAVATLNQGISLAVMAAAERQSAAVENLRDHLDTQEHRFETALAEIGESLRTLPGWQAPAEPLHVATDHSRMRREALSQNAELRFSVLKEWLSINTLAILHRAARGWTTANDLIGTVPSYLQPEAEVLNDSILLIGTRKHTEKLAIPLRQLDSSSDFGQWFDVASEGQAVSQLPAVLMRSNGHFKLVSKGTNSANPAN